MASYRIAKYGFIFGLITARAFAGTPAVPAMSEGFDDVRMLPSLGWSVIDSSDPGALNPYFWYQAPIGYTDLFFPSFDGTSCSFATNNFLETIGGGTISTWLVSPVLAFTPETVASFYTRSVDGPRADRMQVRLCDKSDCVNPGSSPDDVGDFGTVLLDINSTYDLSGYPTAWTQEIVTGLPSSGEGRIALRYFIEDAGISGANGNYAGVDRFEVSNADASPAPSAGLVFDPAIAHRGQIGTLLMSIENPASSDASLSAPLIVTLPAGLTLAASGNMSTTCSGGEVSGGDDGTTFNVGVGTVSPAGGACQVAVDVTAASEGTYTVTLAAGDLHTSAGQNTQPSSTAIQFDGADSENGNIVYRNLDHDIVETNSGTSFDPVNNAFDDDDQGFEGLSLPYVINFYQSFADDTLVFFGINDSLTHIAVNDDGAALALHPGDEVGGALTFSPGADSSADPAWIAGTDAYVGFSFHCDGLLQHPVASGTCYGYVHLRTTGPTGFPATIVDSVVAGDGNPVVIADTDADSIFVDGFDE
jgi:hypothetical protein